MTIEPQPTPNNGVPQPPVLGTTLLANHATAPVIPAPQVIGPVAFDWVWGVVALLVAASSFVLATIMPFLGLVAITGILMAHMGLYRVKRIVPSTSKKYGGTKTTAVLGLIISWLAVHWAILWILGTIIITLLNVWLIGITESMTNNLLAEVGRGVSEHAKDLLAPYFGDVKIDSGTLSELEELLKQLGAK